MTIDKCQRTNIRTFELVVLPLFKCFRSHFAFALICSSFFLCLHLIKLLSLLSSCCEIPFARLHLHALFFFFVRSELLNQYVKMQNHTECYWSDETFPIQMEWNEVAVFEIVAVIRMKSSAFDIHSFYDVRSWSALHFSTIDLANNLRMKSQDAHSDCFLVTVCFWN